MTTSKKPARDVNERLLAAQESERRRIARELHDHVSQQLALLAIEIQQLADALPRSRAEVSRSLRDAWQHTNGIASDVHALAYRLHPSKLEALGLVATIRSYCTQMSHHGLIVRFADRITAGHVTPDAALCLFRVVEEALSNVANHSGSPDADVSLVEDDDELVLRVVDRGRGFVTAHRRVSGLGLLSMRERLETLGGVFKIESGEGKGTLIEARLPKRHAAVAETA